MPRDLFGHLTHPSVSVGSRKWYTLPLSLISHSAIVLALIAIPILAPAAMPSVFADNEPYRIIDVVPPTPPPPPRPRTEPIQHVDPASFPTDVPVGIGPEKPPVETGWESEIGVGTVVMNVDPGVIGPPPAPKQDAPPAPVRPGFLGVRTPVKTHHVDPVYPAIAQSARIQGIVIIEATISETGQVINARLLRSIPLLDQAAIDAVRQWQFTPTMLNGNPVPVIMTVTVNFTLK